MKIIKRKYIIISLLILLGVAIFSGDRDRLRYWTESYIYPIMESFIIQ